ncbi:MAG: uroporphyrinogen-III synthase [Methanobacteriota archaeon]|nr:MAG: uroporphyrinogen-III synthase [Euryarchaeota archaeon]
MNTLKGKKILICRPRQESIPLEQKLNTAGAEVCFFPTFRIEMVPVGDPQITWSLLRDISSFDWVILSSGNGVTALKYFLSQASVSESQLSRVSVGVVGKKTAARVEKNFPGIRPKAIEKDVQTLINNISQHFVKTTGRVLHPTSLQSIEKLSLNIPENVELIRLPLYRTVLNDEFTPEQVEQILATNFDLILFSSPTSFDYFRKFLKDEKILYETNIMSFGKTTARYIESMGYPVAVIPSSPEPAIMTKAIQDFFHQKTVMKLNGRIEQDFLTNQKGDIDTL